MMRGREGEIWQSGRAEGKRDKLVKEERGITERERKRERESQRERDREREFYKIMKIIKGEREKPIREVFDTNGREERKRERERERGQQEKQRF